MLDYIMKYNNPNSGGLRKSYWSRGEEVLIVQRRNSLPH